LLTSELGILYISVATIIGHENLKLYIILTLMPCNDVDMEESLFGGIRFDRLGEELDEDDDDDIYGSRRSEFETESLGSSSTDDEEPLTAVLPPSRQVRRRRHVSTSEESSTDADMEETPTWFYHGPFKYNGRIAVLALPGFVLALLFSGELLVIHLNVISTFSSVL